MILIIWPSGDFVGAMNHGLSTSDSAPAGMCEIALQLSWSNLIIGELRQI
jgi:hypothetical protein